MTSTSCSNENFTSKTKRRLIPSRLLPIILIFVFFFIGITVLCYPFISNYINTLHSSQVIEQLEQALENADDKELNYQRKLAELYNESLRNTGENVSCPYNYEDILSFPGGIMGYLDIPSINIHLPIYHGTGEDALAKGVGHLPDTAFPIGGKGNHSVLTGHTGLPSAKLFTDLTKLGMGDLFTVHILGKTLTYQVDQITIVLPSAVDELLPVAGADYCTLVTCTPYGVNSHRLLVRGRRILTDSDE